MWQYILDFIYWLCEKLWSIVEYFWHLDARVKFNLAFFPIAFTAYIKLFEMYGLLIAVGGMVVLSVMKMIVQYGFDLYERTKITDETDKQKHHQNSTVSNRLEIMGLALMIGLSAGSYFMQDDLLLQLRPIIDNCIIISMILTLRFKSDYLLGGANAVSEKMFGSMVKYDNTVVTVSPRIWNYCDYLSILDSFCAIGIDVLAFALVREGAIDEQEWFKYTTYYSKIPSAITAAMQFGVIMYGREEGKAVKALTAPFLAQLKLIMYGREQGKPKTEEQNKMIAAKNSENMDKKTSFWPSWSNILKVDSDSKSSVLTASPSNANVK